MEHRKELDQEASAAKAGISVRSARRIERAGGLPSKQELLRTRATMHARSAEGNGHATEMAKQGANPAAHTANPGVPGGAA